jgi:hypothetical protein
MLGDINARMEVVGSDGGHVGTVDQLDGACLKLAKDLSREGKPHLIPLEWVDHIDDKVHLLKAARDAMTQWRIAA